MIQEDIYNALINSEEVSSIVGNKIFPIRLPRDIELPAVVYQIQSIEPVVSMSGDSGIDNASVVISVWAKEYLQAHSLANAVRKALISTGLRIISEGSVDNEDSMTRSYGVDLNFKIWSRFYKGASPTPDEDGSKWENDGTTHIKPKQGKKVFASIVDGLEVETGESIKDKLEGLEGESRLDASAIKDFNPKIAGIASFNGTVDNVIMMTNIAKSLQLESGDVIEISGECNAQNKKIRTVENVVNDDQIIVNYEHAENRGNGSLKLYTENNKEVVVRRIVKWYEAPLGLGQDWVETNKNLSFGFQSLSQGNRNWFGMTTDLFGNVYVCVYGGVLYKQTDGQGNFASLGWQSNQNWRGMAANINGDIYACGSDSVGIVKRSFLTGTFSTVASSAGWCGMTANKNGDVYACIDNGGVFKESFGIPGFSNLGQTTRRWHAMASNNDGDVYSCVYTGDIYRQKYGVGDFQSLGLGTGNWRGIAAHSNGDVFCCNSTVGIYRQKGGRGPISVLLSSGANWHGITIGKDFSIYASVYGGDIYKATSFLISNTQNREVSLNIDGVYIMNTGTEASYRNSFSITPIRELRIKERR